MALEAIAVEGQPLVPDVIVSTPQSINNRKEKTKMNIISRFIIVFVMAFGLAFPALGPQDAHAQCYETGAGGFAELKSSSTTDCMVMTAPKKRTLYFGYPDGKDINFQVASNYACWENTTIQGTANSPVDVEWTELVGPGEPPGGPYDVYFRTLTLDNVKLDPDGNAVRLKWPFASDIALTLANAYVNLEAKPLWPSNSMLTLEAVSGDNIIEQLKGNLDAPTTLTVAGGATLKFDSSGSLSRGSTIPDSSRCNFNAATNNADIEGVLELYGSWVIFTMTGGGEMLVHNGGKLLVSTGESVLEARGDLRVDGGSVEMVRNSTIFADDLELSNASLLIEGEANIRTGATAVRDDSTVTLGSTPWDSGARLIADLVLAVYDGDTLTLAGYGSVSTQQLVLFTGAAVKITDSTKLFITGPSAPWSGSSSIEIGPKAFLSIVPGGDATSSIPIHNDGTISVGGKFRPRGEISGDGALRVNSTGTLGILGSAAGNTLTVSPDIFLDFQSTFKPLISPVKGEAQKLIASTSFSLSTLVGVYLEPDLDPDGDVVLAPGTQFVIIEYPEGNELGGLFIRDDNTPLRDGDEITLGLNTYRINYNPTNITLTVVAPDRTQANDDYYTALQDQTLTVPADGVLANDVNVTGTPAVVDPPMHGTVTLNPDGSFTYTPAAGFFGDDSFTYQVGTSNVATVYIHVRAQADCTLTAGYWQTHTGSGGARLDTTWLELPQGPITPFFLSGETYLEVLAKEPEGNAYYILAQQYIAAELNFLRGADPSAVQTEFDDAKALFEQYTPEDAAALEPADRQYWITLALILDRYNNGDLGPGACPEEGPSGE